MSEVNDWLKAIKEQEIHAVNKCNVEGLSLCFNFIEIPESNGIVALTLSVLNDGHRRNAMNPISFARIMNDIEGSLYNVAEIGKVENPLCCCSVVSKIDKDWYRFIRAHRVFFITKETLWVAIKEIFDSHGIECFKNEDVAGVSVYVNTSDYRCSMRFH